MTDRTAKPIPNQAIKMAPRRVTQSGQRPIPAEQNADISPRAVREKLLQSFGSIVASLVDVPRYRNHSIADLQFLILEALVRDRILLVRQGGTSAGVEPDVAAIAIWASVSESVNTKIREQINAGVFPVRLLPDEWTSGNISWLLDIVTRSPDVAKQVVTNFGQVSKSDRINLHPAVGAMLDRETLDKLGVKRL